MITGSVPVKELSVRYKRRNDFISPISTALMARYLELTSDRFTEHHALNEGFHVISPSPTWRHLGEDESIAEDCIGGNWQAIRLMLGPEMDYFGATACFAFPAPGSAAAYSEFFSPCSVEFNAERSELRIPSEWLEFPISTGNVLMSDMTSAICERLLGPGRSTRIDTARAVRRLLLSRPGQRMLRLEEAASEMMMSTAQLRKRLYRCSAKRDHRLPEDEGFIARSFKFHRLPPTQKSYRALLSSGRADRAPIFVPSTALFANNHGQRPIR